MPILHRLRRPLALLGLCAAFAAPLPAVAVTWKMATEYPATSMPGEGVRDFTERLARLTRGAVTVQPSYDAAAGIKSAGMLAAVQARQLDVGDAFAGSLGTRHPLLGLSSLPFVADSLPKARELLNAARPAYDKLLAAQGQKLLYTTPWPASGIWSKAPINSAADLRALSIRTYDETSQVVMTRAGARAANISFADAMPRIAAGDVNAVLSSGDGGAGRKLWEHLPHFTEINYAMPISIATVNLQAWQALSDAERQAVERAGAETEAAQWQRIENRLAENYAAMQRNGVTIQRNVPADVRAALRDAAADAIRDWRTKAGDEGTAILQQFAPR